MHATSPGGAPDFDAAELSAWADDALSRCIELVADLDEGELAGPRLPVVNPLLWELGHVAWFAERFVLREGLGAAPLRADGDALFDSIAVAHEARWDLPLASRAELFAYAAEVRERVAAALRDDPDLHDGRARRAEGAPRTRRELSLLAILHADMHAEAFTYCRQTRALSAPRALPPAPSSEGASGAGAPRATGDAEIPGGTFVLGAEPSAAFAFDNELRAHRRRVAPFRIARVPVTEAQLLELVLDRGYARPELWSAEGWRWRVEAGAELPLYWRRAGDSYEVRAFDRWRPLEPDLPATHVSWHEAEAWCRWAGRRLPSELEWEVAASGQPASGGGGALAAERRRLPWGEGPGAGERARLDGRGGGPVGVDAHPGGDSAFGCRQMLGNVWEWTSTTFGPYPGFEPGAYREYSAPWFGTRKVLRGGSWATRSRLAWCSHRNFFEPHRRDVLAGFRTCAL